MIHNGSMARAGCRLKPRGTYLSVRGTVSRYSSHSIGRSRRPKLRNSFPERAQCSTCWLELTSLLLSMLLARKNFIAGLKRASNGRSVGALTKPRELASQTLTLWNSTGAQNCAFRLLEHRFIRHFCAHGASSDSPSELYLVVGLVFALRPLEGPRSSIGLL